ncbi:MAG: outer membrane beta-barrel protein [Pseudomonadota bacterium]
MKRIAPLVLCLLIFAGPHQAYAKGWGFSAGVGVSQMRDRDPEGTFEGNDFGYLFNFEYRFTQHFALGVGGFNLGADTDIVNGEEILIDVHGSDFFVRGIAPISESVEIYGRIGGASYDVNNRSFLFADDAFEIGLGVDFIPGKSEHLAIRLEGLFFNGSSDESGGLATIGFSYRF